MRALFTNLKGDKAIWGVVALLALFSFLPVYSASTHLVYVNNDGTTLGHLHSNKGKPFKVVGRDTMHGIDDPKAQE